MSDEAKAVYRVDNVSRGWMRRYARMEAAMRASGESADVGAVDAAYDEQGKMLAQVVESVPRAWLVPDAPDSLDWSDPASFDWVKISKMQTLVMGLFKAVSAGN